MVNTMTFFVNHVALRPRALELGRNKAYMRLALGQGEC